MGVDCPWSPGEARNPGTPPPPPGAEEALPKEEPAAEDIQLPFPRALLLVLFVLSAPFPTQG